MSKLSDRIVQTGGPLAVWKKEVTREGRSVEEELSNSFSLKELDAARSLLKKRVKTPYKNWKPSDVIKGFPENSELKRYLCKDKEDDFYTFYVNILNGILTVFSFWLEDDISIEYRKRTLIQMSLYEIFLALKPGENPYYRYKAEITLELLSDTFTVTLSTKKEGHPLDFQISLTQEEVYDYGSIKAKVEEAYESGIPSNPI